MVRKRCARAPAAHNQTNATALVIDCDELTINLLFCILQESVDANVASSSNRKPKSNTLVVILN